MNDFILGLIQRLGHWAYLLIFLSTALETAAFLGLAVPGETIAVLGGFMAQRGLLGLGETLVVVIAGAIAGDSVGYLLGSRLGRPWLHRLAERLGLEAGATRRLEELFRRRGGVAVVIGRLTAVMRAFTPFIAGSSRMYFRSFIAYKGREHRGRCRHRDSARALPVAEAPTTPRSVAALTAFMTGYTNVERHFASN